MLKAPDFTRFTAPPHEWIPELEAPRYELDGSEGRFGLLLIVVAVVLEVAFCVWCFWPGAFN